jgi:hypothetical protein
VIIASEYHGDSGVNKDVNILRIPCAKRGCIFVDKVVDNKPAEVILTRGGREYLQWKLF